MLHAFRADIIASSAGVTFDRMLPVSDIMNLVYGTGMFSRHDLTQNRESRSGQHDSTAPVLGIN